MEAIRPNEKPWMSCLKPYQQRFFKGLPEQRHAAVERFFDGLFAEGRKPKTITHAFWAITSLGREGKPYAELTEDDIVAWLALLRSNGNKERTIRDFRAGVKQFLTQVFVRKTGKVPEYIKAVKIARIGASVSAEDIYSREEVRMLLKEACRENPRDPALIHVHYEGGLRDGELLSMKIRSVEFNDYGAKIHVNGKTGKRTVQLIESVPELKEWHSLHPHHDDPEAPLWPSLSVPNNAFGEDGLQILYKKYAKLAGITKRIYPYLMRHSRATHLASIGFNEAQLRKYFGWSKDSKMPSIYIHLSGRDVDEGLLRAYGIKPEGVNDLSELTPKACPRCSFQNPTTSDFCKRCQSPLDEIIAQTVEIKEQSDEIVTKVVGEVLRRAPELVREVLREKGYDEKIMAMVEGTAVESNPVGSED